MEPHPTTFLCASYRAYKNPRLRRTGDYLCARGDLNPHPLIRGLAPQASASAYSATRAGDIRTFSLRCRSKQHVILYGLSGNSANQKSMLYITLMRGGVTDGTNQTLHRKTPRHAPPPADPKAVYRLQMLYDWQPPQTPRFLSGTTRIRNYEQREPLPRRSRRTFGSHQR